MPGSRTARPCKANWSLGKASWSLGLFVSCSTLSFPVHAYQLIGAAWDADLGPVRYHLEPTGSDDIDDGSDLQAVRDAFERWACVPGSSFRVVEDPTPGVKAIDLEDGINTVFWDEDGSLGLGPATLGITVGTAPGTSTSVVREAADIVFNGFDSTWATDEAEVMAGKVDVASIAIHEAGHWAGLAHPCDDAAETQCLGPDEAVMTPAYPGGLMREPRADDIAGMVAMYPATDESRCDGPFRQGEVCSCNEDCVSGLLCVDALDGTPVCSPSCDGNAATCPVGFACVLGARPTNGGPAPGVCLRLAADAKKPLASLCERDSDCEAGLCVPTPVIGRTVCKKSCEVAEDCPASYSCVESVCAAQGASDGIACPAEPSEAGACGCQVASPAPAGSGGALGALATLCVGFALLRRRRAHAVA